MLSYVLITWCQLAVRLASVAATVDAHLWRTYFAGFGRCRFFPASVVHLHDGLAKVGGVNLAGLIALVVEHVRSFVT